MNILVFLVHIYREVGAPIYVWWGGGSYAFTPTRDALLESSLNQLYIYMVITIFSTLPQIPLTAECWEWWIEYNWPTEESLAFVYWEKHLSVVANACQACAGENRFSDSQILSPLYKRIYSYFLKKKEKG